MRRCLHCLRLGEGGWHGGFGWYAWRGRYHSRGMNPRAYGHVSADQQKVMSWPEVCRGPRRWDGAPQTDRSDLAMT
jgi:hypothetical protein